MSRFEMIWFGGLTAILWGLFGISLCHAETQKQRAERVSCAIAQQPRMMHAYQRKALRNEAFKQMFEANTGRPAPARPMRCPSCKN